MKKKDKTKTKRICDSCRNRKDQKMLAFIFLLCLIGIAAIIMMDSIIDKIDFTMDVGLGTVYVLSFISLVTTASLAPALLLFAVLSSEPSEVDAK